MRPRAGVRGLGAAFRGGWAPQPWGHGGLSAGRSVCLADVIGVVGKSEVTVHRLLSGPVLKSSCTLSPLWSLIHPTLPHRFFTFTFFYVVSTPPSHCSGIWRGVSPEGSRNVLSVRGETGEWLPRCVPIQLEWDSYMGPPRSRGARKSFDELGRSPRVPASRLLVFR